MRVPRTGRAVRDDGSRSHARCSLPHVTWLTCTTFVILALLAVPTCLYAQETAGATADTVGATLAIAAGFGAIGGVVYELIALHGNIEWPHRATDTEGPTEPLPDAQVKFLFDLGIVARVVIGAAAAVIVFWLLPVEQGIRLMAVSIIAGSAGTAVFRSVQDRMLTALSSAKIDTLASGMKELEADVDELAIAAASGVPAGSAMFAPGQPQVEVQMRLAAVAGQLKALRKVAGRN